MKPREFKSLGLKVAFNVPETVDEFNANAKAKPDTNPCLDEAVGNVVYRGCMAEFRDLFLHGRKEVAAADGKPAVPGFTGIEELTNIERLTEPVKGKDGKPIVRDGEPVTKYSESEGDYFDRVLAQLNKKAEDYQSLADSAATQVVFDASSTPRSPAGPKKLAAKYKLTAARILAAGNVDKYNTSRLALIGKTFTPSGDMTKTYTGSYEALDPATLKPTGETKTVSVSDKDAEALGWLVKEVQDFKERAALEAEAAS